MPGGCSGGAAALPCLCQPAALLRPSLPPRLLPRLPLPRLPPCPPRPPVPLAPPRQAYIIDQVLIPGDSLQALPSLPASNASSGGGSNSSSGGGQAAGAPSPSPSPAPPANETLYGVAVASGYLANCTVQLLSNATNASAVTDAAGRFALDCGAAGCAALSNASAVLPAAGQPADCRDNATGLSPPYQLGALLLPANLSTNGSGGEGQPLVLGPLQALAADAQLPGTDAAALAAQYYALLRSLLGLQSEAAAAFGDPVQGTVAGDADATNLQISSQQLQVAVGVGAAALGNLAPASAGDAPLAVLSRAVIQAAAASTLNLTSPDAVTSLLQTAFDALTGNSIASALTSSASASGRRLLGPRRLAQAGGNGTAAPAPANDGGNGTAPASQQQVLASVGSVVASLCGALDEAYSARVNGSIADGAALLQVSARVTTVAQGSVTPAVMQLAAGGMSAAAFDAQFNETGLASLVDAVQLPGSPGLA